MARYTVDAFEGEVVFQPEKSFPEWIFNGTREDLEESIRLFFKERPGKTNLKESE